MPKLLASCAVLCVLAPGADAGFVYTTAPHPDGLAATAEFTLLNPTTLQVVYENTSTGVPNGFSNSDQVLSTVSWDFGHPGYNGDTHISGGTVVTGPTSFSVNFDVTSVGPNTSVSGEFGYGNMDGTGALTNFVSSNNAQVTPFGGPNLDGPSNIDGPQGGLVPASGPILPVGGLGVIQGKVIATLTLTIPITEAELAADLENNGVRFEFGSDAAFLDGVPAPAGTALFATAGALLARRRR